MSEEVFNFIQVNIFCEVSEFCFYDIQLVLSADILGLQQIRRPNFDRHGAWLTMGNVELHLIKGVPTIYEGFQSVSFNFEQPAFRS